MPLDQHDTEWLDEKFGDLYKHIDAASKNTEERERTCRAAVDARITLAEAKAALAAEMAAALRVEVDWHKWYIRTALGFLIVNSGGVAILAVKVFNIV